MGKGCVGFADCCLRNLTALCFGASARAPTAMSSFRYRTPRRHSPEHRATHVCLNNGNLGLPLTRRLYDSIRIASPTSIRLGLATAACTTAYHLTTPSSMNPHISLPRPTGGPANFGSTPSSRRNEIKMPRFFKRMFKFPQMDFEMAIWEIMSLIIAPKKVFRQIYYHVCGI